MLNKLIRVQDFWQDSQLNETLSLILLKHGNLVDRTHSSSSYVDRSLKILMPTMG